GQGKQEGKDPGGPSKQDETGVAMGKGLGGRPGMGNSEGKVASRDPGDGGAEKTPTRQGPPGSHRAAEIQLQRIKDLLKKEKYLDARTSEDLKKQVRALEESIKRRKPEAAAREDVPRPAGVNSLPSVGGQA